jgi:hypothetical protein
MSGRVRLPKAFATGAAAIALLGGGVAWAHWSASGSGTTSGSTATLQTVTVTALAGADQPASSLLPGGPPAEVILRVSNPNPYPVRLYSITATGAVSADSGHPGCTNTGVSFVPPADPDISVPGSSTLLIRLPDAASMATSSPAGCQGATFHIPVTVAART